MALWIVYRSYVRRNAHEFEIRLAERVGERTRIARELHDSLLQGLQGLLFRLQAIRELLPDQPTGVADALETALELCESIVTDARDTVDGLRSSSLVGSDLELALRSLGEELATPERSLAILVQGFTRNLTPLARDDAYRIAREALRNAVRHAKARKIEVELEYGHHEFSIRIRDDGVGIDADVAARGRRAGRWGLQGMHERAAHLGAVLHVWSERGAGTEIELAIPGEIAYGSSSHHPGGASK
jgi:signal transduction histidine kinase